MLRSLVTLAVTVCGFSLAAAQPPVRHPIILFGKEEAAAIRKRIETDPQAKQQYELMTARERSGKTGKGGANPDFMDLFDYAVMGSEAAGQRQKAALLKFIGAAPPGARAGNPETGNAPWRDDRTLDALRYDVLYDLLSPEQRKGVEDTIRFYVDWFTKNPGPLAAPERPRTGWLPNMQWPTAAGVHVLAVASGDPKLIEAVFNATGGWKWYMDNYIADGRFYMEEFGKFASNIGAMLLWCEGLERLGLGKYGWGYTSNGGANMKNFLTSLWAAGYPRIERPEHMPGYEIVNMGDAGPLHIVNPVAAVPESIHPWWYQARMQGVIQKMCQPLWWEIGHRRFPDAGFDYFLAQMRKSGQDVYLPSLYFGLGPIDARKVKAPPAPPLVSRGRGFAMLRADESPAFWESPKPAVELQFGMYYVHYVHDCFAILQFVAHNRYLYNKMGTLQIGYAGGDPWRDHVRGQGSGVVVDGLKPRYVDDGEEGCKNQRIRHRFAPPMKYVAVGASNIYPEVEQERALVLTDDYLLDVFFLSSPRPRVYDWHVMSPAIVVGGDKEPWKPLSAYAGGKVANLQLAKPHLSNISAIDAADQPWKATLALVGSAQQAAAADTVGVNVLMLGGEPTAVVYGRPPGVDGIAARKPATGPAGAPAVKLLATRTGPATVFPALHEPYRGPAGTTKIQQFSRVAQSSMGIAVAVVGTRGSGINDRIIIRNGPKAEQYAKFASDEESFTVADQAFVRISDQQVEVWGDLSAMKIKVSGKPKFIVNGKTIVPKLAGGMLEYIASP